MSYPDRAIRSQNFLYSKMRKMFPAIVFRPRSLNRHIYIPFLKSIGERYYKINPNYKGMCNGCDDNAIIISNNHSSDFFDWLIEYNVSIVVEYSNFEHEQSSKAKTKGRRKTHRQNYELACKWLDAVSSEE